jgi:hypothetical protein
MRRSEVYRANARSVAKLYCCFLFSSLPFRRSNSNVFAYACKMAMPRDGISFMVRCIARCSWIYAKPRGHLHVNEAFRLAIICFFANSSFRSCWNPRRGNHVLCAFCCCWQLRRFSYVQQTVIFYPWNHPFYAYILCSRRHFLYLYTTCFSWPSFRIRSHSLYNQRWMPSDRILVAMDD